MSLAQGYFSKPFLAQVAPDQNQHVKNAEWKDAHGDRVRIRIPGKHPSSNEVKDDQLPWAIVSHPTTHGNLNGGSCGVWGGEWVIACYMDEAQQIPIVLSVLGNNLTDSQLKKSKNGTTEFKRVDRYNSGLTPGRHQIIGDSKKPKGPAQPTKEEIKGATKDPESKNVSESGVPKEPTIRENPDGSRDVIFTERVAGEIEKSTVRVPAGEEISQGLLYRQETSFNAEMSNEALKRGDYAAQSYYADKLKGG